MSAPKFIKSHPHTKSGFTLIEMLIVVALIALLLLLFIIGARLQLAKGYDATRKADLNRLRIAFEEYASDHGCYPDPAILADCGGKELQPYLESIPCDPETKKPYVMTVDKGICAGKFIIAALLANSNDPDINCSRAGYYAVGSNNVTGDELFNGCGQGGQICATYYICRSGACVASGSFRPACGPIWCEGSCGSGQCSKPINECH